MIGLTLAKEIVGLLFFRYETGDIVSAGHIRWSSGAEKRWYMLPA